MAYNNSIPQPGDQPKDSQPQILTNFAAIKTLIDVNHVTFDAAGEGKHKFVTLPVQAAAPVLAADNGLYNVLNAITNKNETYTHNQTFAGTSDIPFTASSLSTSIPVSGDPGWTYLPSGLLLRWEWISSVGGLSTVNLAGLTPAFTQIIAVLLTPFDNSGVDSDIAVRLDVITDPSHFDVYFSKRTTTGPAAGDAVALIIGY